MNPDFIKPVLHHYIIQWNYTFCNYIILFINQNQFYFFIQFCIRKLFHIVYNLYVKNILATNVSLNVKLFVAGHPKFVGVAFVNVNVPVPVVS